MTAEYFALNNSERLRQSDYELYKIRLLSAADTPHKMNYINGKISLWQYLQAETLHRQRLNGFAKIRQSIEESDKRK